MELEGTEKGPVAATETLPPGARRLTRSAAGRLRVGP